MAENKDFSKDMLKQMGSLLRALDTLDKSSLPKLDNLTSTIHKIESSLKSSGMSVDEVKKSLKDIDAIKNSFNTTADIGYKLLNQINTSGISAEDLFKNFRKMRGSFKPERDFEDFYSSLDYLQDYFNIDKVFTTGTSDLQGIANKYKDQMNSISKLLTNVKFDPNLVNKDIALLKTSYNKVIQIMQDAERASSSMENMSLGDRVKFRDAIKYQISQELNKVSDLTDAYKNSFDTAKGYLNLGGNSWKEYQRETGHFLNIINGTARFLGKGDWLDPIRQISKGANKISKGIKEANRPDVSGSSELMEEVNKLSPFISKLAKIGPILAGIGSLLLGAGMLINSVRDKVVEFNKELFQYQGLIDMGLSFDVDVSPDLLTAKLDDFRTMVKQYAGDVLGAVSEADLLQITGALKEQGIRMSEYTDSYEKYARSMDAIVGEAKKLGISTTESAGIFGDWMRNMMMTVPEISHMLDVANTAAVESKVSAGFYINRLKQVDESISTFDWSIVNVINMSKRFVESSKLGESFAKDIYESYERTVNGMTGANWQTMVATLAGGDSTILEKILEEEKSKASQRVISSKISGNKDETRKAQSYMDRLEGIISNIKAGKQSGFDAITTLSSATKQKIVKAYNRDFLKNQKDVSFDMLKLGDLTSKGLKPRNDLKALLKSFTGLSGWNTKDMRSFINVIGEGLNENGDLIDSGEDNKDAGKDDLDSMKKYQKVIKAYGLNVTKSSDMVHAKFEQMIAPLYGPVASIFNLLFGWAKSQGKTDTADFKAMYDQQQQLNINISDFKGTISSSSSLSGKFTKDLSANFPTSEAQNLIKSIEGTAKKNQVSADMIYTFLLQKVGGNVKDINKAFTMLTSLKFPNADFDKYIKSQGITQDQLENFTKKINEGKTEELMKDPKYQKYTQVSSNFLAEQIKTIEDNAKSKYNMSSQNAKKYAVMAMERGDVLNKAQELYQVQNKKYASSLEDLYTYFNQSSGMVLSNSDQLSRQEFLATFNDFVSFYKSNLVVSDNNSNNSSNTVKAPSNVSIGEVDVGNVNIGKVDIEINNEETTNPNSIKNPEYLKKKITEAVTEALNRARKVVGGK